MENKIITTTIGGVTVEFVCVFEDGMVSVKSYVDSILFIENYFKCTDVNLEMLKNLSVYYLTVKILKELHDINNKKDFDIWLFNNLQVLSGCGFDRDVMIYITNYLLSLYY